MQRDIKVLTDVKDLSELLSGARIERVRLLPSGGGMQLSAELTRAMPERQTVIRQGLFRRLKTPWTACELELFRVTSVAVKHLTDLAPDQTPVIACEAVPGGYQFTVQAPDGLQLVLNLDQLDGSFADIGAPIASP
jgi:hypothetical protein